MSALGLRFVGVSATQRMGLGAVNPEFVIGWFVLWNMTEVVDWRSVVLEFRMPTLMDRRVVDYLTSAPTYTFIITNQDKTYEIGKKIFIQRS